jgi:hypothetical protein
MGLGAAKDFARYHYVLNQRPRRAAGRSSRLAHDRQARRSRRPNHEEDIKRVEQNRLDAEKIASPNVDAWLYALKTLKVDKVERFFRHRHTKGLVNFGSSPPISSFGLRKSSCGDLYQSIK